MLEKKSIGKLKYKKTGEPALVWDVAYGNSDGQGGLPWRNELRSEKWI